MNRHDIYLYKKTYKPPQCRYLSNSERELKEICQYCTEDNSEAQMLRTLAGIPSGPLALFTSRLGSTLRISNCILLVFCIPSSGSEIYNLQHEPRTFPEGLKFGAATASYQIEGAWDEDGKSESIWDHATHKNPSSVVDQSTGDIADNSYHQYKRDVEMMRELGLDFYRFSISWPRILPSSFSDQVNAAGVAYYNNLINEMLKYNIEPMVTLYHWDLPQKLQELGGWTNPYIIDWFADYVRVVFGLYGDRVKKWITINEPLLICYNGYGSDEMAPQLNISGVADYICAKNLLLAHAKAYNIYNDEFRPTQKGVIGITISAQWYEPESEEHTVAAEDANQFDWGIYANPIFSESGDYPAVIKERIAAKSAEQGFSRSRLMEFTTEEVDYVRGTSDFFGINHYTSFLVYRNESANGKYIIPSYLDDMGVVKHQKDEWIIGELNYIKRSCMKARQRGNATPTIKAAAARRSFVVRRARLLQQQSICQFTPSLSQTYVPWGFHKLLRKIREDYNNIPIYITESGYASHGGLHDDERVLYYRGYLNALIDAMEEGSDVRGYTAWSMMDNFEWMKGYTYRFGLYEVDYESPERTRNPRKSAFVYKEILRTRKLDWSYEPDTDVMTIEEGH
ncbi:myrosinase 1-like [Aphomia sociella]